MCGSGRLLVPLATRGHKMQGVDLSAAMLAQCEARLAARQVTAPLFRQDITQMNLPFRYGCALIAGAAFQLVTDPGAALGALGRLRAHLVAPGILLIDAEVPAAAVQRLGAPLVEVRTVKLADGSQITLRSETTWWADARLVRAEQRFAHRLGAERLAEEHETVTRVWYPPEDLASLVREAGFEDVRIGTSPRTADDAETFAIEARL
jgi:ubiquinone/menaquinone biosynthesis C-methylase UbiE